MPIQTVYILVCDTCPEIREGEPNRPLREVIAQASSLGWFVTYRGGAAVGACCPECVLNRMNTSRSIFPKLRRDGAFKGHKTRREVAA